MENDKGKHSDELMNRIRNELTAILAQEATDESESKKTHELLLSPNPLPIFGPIRKSRATKTSSSTKKLGKPPSAGSRKSSSAGSGSSGDRLAGGDAQKKDTDPTSTSSSFSLKSGTSSRHEAAPKDRSARAEFLESHGAKSIDDDVQRMQMELKQSYELFQSIGEKFESVNFSGLKSRIRDLHLNDSNNELGKATTQELQKMFDQRYLQNRLDKLATDATQGFRRHPGEFGDIPELSTFFQACTQLEHGLDALRQQRRRNSDLEKRLCWATEIAYDRMDEIRNSVGSDPEKNF
ncbi:uncharacterized protein LOC128266218 [Drosophila gunungcola]|uniref:Uncharacterized protein n=1 Tax=Drosophila gunungcola TaxID=103775 RepID=A0A9P9Z291_9MUSC|nr:uncharacterized protein LOC128266218 [Drosophila gunungcola]KAI8046829.1 hypothetical protein M5D96_003043 [Drosophila gunungcola]